MRRQGRERGWCQDPEQRQEQGKRWERNPRRLCHWGAAHLDQIRGRGGGDGKGALTSAGPGRFNELSALNHSVGHGGISGRAPNRVGKQLPCLKKGRTQELGAWLLGTGHRHQGLSSQEQGPVCGQTDGLTQGCPKVESRGSCLGQGGKRRRGWRD